MSLQDDLERLAKLHGSGRLTDDEYREAKNALLGHGDPGKHRSTGSAHIVRYFLGLFGLGAGSVATGESR